MYSTIAALLLFQVAAERPEALARFEAARKAIRLADVTFTVVNLGDHHNATPEPWRQRWLCTENEVVLIGLGTDSGVVGTWDGKPRLGGPLGEYWDSAGDYWSYRMDGITAQLRRGSSESPQRPYDFRSLGMSYRPIMDARPDQAMARGMPPEGFKCSTEYFTEVRDGIHRVEARSTFPDGKVQSVFWNIDPKLDWNATRCEIWFDGKPWEASETEYERINGVVVPVFATYIRADGNPYQMYVVEQAKINEKDLPTELTPDYIGLEPGVNIFARGEPAAIYVGGGQTYPPREAFLLERDGVLEMGPKLKAARAKKPIPWSVPEPAEAKAALEKYRARLQQAERETMDKWERYTIDFITRYRLNDEQTTKATQILSSCRTQRDRYLRARREDIRAARKRINSETDAARQTPHRDRLRRLLEPVQVIFEKQLKPRLDRLPTRDQRAAAEGRDSPDAQDPQQPGSAERRGPR